MKLRLVSVQQTRDTRIVHVVDQDSSGDGVLCGAVTGFDWRMDRGLGKVDNLDEIECPTCRRLASDLLGRA